MRRMGEMTLVLVRMYRKRDHLGDMGADGMIILKWVIKE